MKKLTLLMFTILILGCGTEKPVVEEPEPVVEEPPPVVMEPEPIGHPLVAEGTVTHGEVNVDPKPLNRSGFHFLFKESFLSYWVSLREKDGKYLYSWDFPEVDRSNETDLLFLQPIGDPLDYDTEYEIVISVHNDDCESTEIVIQFRTKPQRPLAGGPAPVIQERPPVVPSGGHFRLDISAPAVVLADVLDGDNDVDPELLNVNGIQFEFDEHIRRYKMDLRLHNGASLGWLPRGLVKPENRLRHIKIMRAEGAPLLEFNTVYEIDIFVEDFGCLTTEFQIVFATKPKP